MPSGEPPKNPLRPGNSRLSRRVGDEVVIGRAVLTGANRTTTRQTFYARLATMAKQEASLTESHSIEEANELHQRKHRPKS
jgi:hypothetical protein